MEQADEHKSTTVSFPERALIPLSEAELDETRGGITSSGTGKNTDIK